MEIKELHIKKANDSNKNTIDAINQFNRLLAVLRKRDLPKDFVVTINIEIDKINNSTTVDKGMRKQVRNSQSKIIRLLEKQLKLVPINYYRNTWLALGMAAFGIPLGTAYGLITGNMAYLAIGIPIGMVIGIGVGTIMDKKAMEEGRQLDIEIKP